MAIDRFTKERFEQALPRDRATGKPLWVSGGLDRGEEVYHIPVTDTNKRIVVRSTVQPNGFASAKGKDSIQVWVEYKSKGEWHALGKDGRAWTSRIKGWEDRLLIRCRKGWEMAKADSLRFKSTSKPGDEFNDLGEMLETGAEANAEIKAELRENKAKAKVICPACGRPMKLRSGPYGDFHGCTGYPVHCNKTLQIDEVDQATGVAIEPVKDGEFVASTLQAAIFDFVAGGQGNAMVEAVAGSGKTTTIVKALELTSGSVLFCAFNKHIRDELARRAPKHVNVSTIHSLGRSALVKSLKHKPELDEKKLWGIVAELLPMDDEYSMRQPLAQLVSMCKKTLTDGGDAKAVDALADYYDIDMNGDTGRIVDLVPIALATCIERLSVIDFDDMIWLPIVLNLPMTRYNWVFVDEAQDLSKSQATIVEKSLAKDGRIVLVGDRHQSIYGFTGADCDSIPRLIETFNCQTLPLSITYRCPTKVVELAQKLVPQITATDWAKEGSIENVGAFNWMSRVRDRDLVLCRVNAPLVKTCFGFIRQGRKAVIRGRDIGKGLTALIDKLRATGVGDLLAKLGEYERKEIRRLEKAGKEVRIETLMDKVETLIALTDGCDNLTELRHRIDTIFNDVEKGGIVLSSIHRAKGDGAETVFILKPELLPHPRAIKDWQLVQEANLEYVAYTRSKNTLVFVRG